MLAVMYTRVDVIGFWSEAAVSGTLQTAKHDPNGNWNGSASYRTVLTQEVSASLEGLVTSGQYSITRYTDRNHAGGAGYFEVVLDPSCGFDVVGSGIPSDSSARSGELDRLVFVSGSKQGWHVFAESEAGVKQLITNGRLQLSGSL